jgi:hypothetical protein
MTLKIKNDYLIEEIINNPNYEIKENGEVFTTVARTGKVTLNKIWRNCVYTNKNGYQCIRYKYKSLQLHRIIYRKFNGELNDKLVINHIDGNPSNNCVDNLELVTQSKNIEHSYRVLNKKPVIGYSKINKEIADKIREEYKIIKSYKRLMKKYSLAKSTIHYIITNRIWK